MAKKRKRVVIVAVIITLAILAVSTQCVGWHHLNRARRNYDNGEYLSSFVLASRAKSLLLFSESAGTALDRAGDALVKEMVDQLIDSLRNGGWPPKDITLGAWGDARIRFKDEAGLGYVYDRWSRIEARYAIECRTAALQEARGAASRKNIDQLTRFLAAALATLGTDTSQDEVSSLVALLQRIAEGDLASGTSKTTYDSLNTLDSYLPKAHSSTDIWRNDLSRLRDECVKQCGVKVPFEVRGAFLKKGYIVLDPNYQGRLPAFELSISCEQGTRHKYSEGGSPYGNMGESQNWAQEWAGAVVSDSRDDLITGVAYRWDVRATAVGTLKADDGTVIQEFRATHLEKAPERLQVLSTIDNHSQPKQALIDHLAKQKVISELAKVLEKELLHLGE